MMDDYEYLTNDHRSPKWLPYAIWTAVAVSIVLLVMGMLA